MLNVRSIIFQIAGDDIRREYGKASVFSHNECDDGFRAIVDKSLEGKA